MKKTLQSFGVLLGVCLLFFWPIMKGFIPFPGDVLINSNPYRSLSVLGYTPGSYPNKAQGKDVITEMYPWRYFTIQELKQGRIPFWNPHNFSGNILMQNLQSSVFNPFNIFFFMLPFVRGWTLFIFIQPVLASFFFYLFARQLKLSQFASILGAISFAFSSYMTVWMEYGNIAATLAYLPLVLFFILRFIQQKNISSYIGFIIAAVVMFLSGYIQGAFYIYVIAVCFTLVAMHVYKVKATRFFLLFLGLMFVFPLFLSALQYIPTYQVFLASTRWPYSLQQFQSMLQPYWYWVTLFASDFFGNPATRNYYLPITYIERVAYVGIPFLIFSIYSIFHKREFTFFFLSVAVLILILTTNLPGIAYLYKLPIPVINTTVPTRSLSIFVFAMVVLGMFGIDEFIKRKKYPKNVILFFLSAYSALWIGIFAAKKVISQFSPQISVTQHNLFIPTFLMFGTLSVFFLMLKFQRIAKVLLFFLVVFDLLYVFQKITPFSPVQTIYPSHPVITYMQENAGINRFWGYGSGYIEPNFQTVDGIYSPEGNDPLHIKTYGELLASSTDGKISPLPPRPDANLASGYGQDGMKNQYRQTLLNLLGIKYVVQHDETHANGDPDTATFPQSIYQLVWSQSPWQIYENKQVLPRYFLANHYIVAQGQKALDALYSVDLRKTIILSSKLSTSFSNNATGEATLLSYGPQKIVFRTDTTDAMLLFLSDTYFPSWGVQVDKMSTPMYVADYTFRAVIVPKGKHTITMVYQSQFFVIGLRISIIALILFIFSILCLKKYEKKI